MIHQHVNLLTNHQSFSLLAGKGTIQQMDSYLDGSGIKAVIESQLLNNSTTLNRVLKRILIEGFKLHHFWSKNQMARSRLDGFVHRNIKTSIGRCKSAGCHSSFNTVFQAQK